MVEDRDVKTERAADRSDRDGRPTDRKTWRREINARLRRAYEDVLNEPVPETFRHLFAAENVGAAGGPQDPKF